jgi:hypothetical protein
MTQDDGNDPGARGAAASGVDTSGVTAPGVDWDAVRHDFLHSGMAQRRIAWKHGTSANKMRERQRAEGWVRVAPCVKRPTRWSGPRAGEPPTPTQLRRGRLNKRLHAILDAKLTELELRMAERKDGPQNAADTERDTRTLTAILQIITKLGALEDAARAADKNDKNANENADTTGARTEDDADRLRRDLAARLARIRAGGS